MAPVTIIIHIIITDVLTSLGGKSVTVEIWAPLGQYSVRETGHGGAGVVKNEDNVFCGHKVFVRYFYNL